MKFAAVLVVALVGSGHFTAVTGKSTGSRRSSSETGETCKLSLQSDLDPKKEPLLLSVKETEIRDRVETLEIVRPKVEDRNKGVITVDSGKELLLACPGTKNHNEASNEQSAYVSCKGGNLMIGGKKANKKSMSCSKSQAISSLKITDNSCGSGQDTGTLVQLGFELDDKSWFPLVDVCHNITHSVTLYASHQLYGKSLKGAVKSSDRRKFTRGPKPLFAEVNPDSVYVRKGQVKAFDYILKENGHTLYINDAHFLARGHLAPDADFVYNSGQLLTYYYINAAPQWQPFNAGNWLYIENAVRALADREQETLNVHTGTYGILKLANAKGEERMIFLEPVKKLIPVPEVYWKIVQHPVTRSCTVAVGHNNVYLTKAPTPLCKTASPGGWPTLDNLEKGYTYYCDYSSFKKTVTFAPNLDCKDLFEYPQSK